MNFFKIITIAFLFIITTSSFASEPRIPADINEESVVSMEEATQDLMNRFVLAFFGKNALQMFTPYDIDNIDEERPELYISPFPNFHKFLGYTFYIVAFLAFIISIFYLLYVIYDGIFKSQKTGEFLGATWNPLFLVLKIGISLSLTVPFYNSQTGIGYNGTQFLVFYTFGKSKESADEMIRDFSRTNATLQPEVPMPKTYSSARSLTDSLLDFAMCINENHRKIYGGKSIISMEEYVLDGEFHILASKRNCKVLLSFPLNSGFENGVNADNTLSTYFESRYSIDRDLFGDNDNPYYNYASAMIESYRNLTDRLLLNSSKIMNAYMMSERKIKHPNLFEALNDFGFSEFLIENRGGEKWENLCPLFYSRLNELDKVSDFESLFIRQFGGNCLSNELISSIVLPASSHERDKILNSNRDFYLLCSNENLVNNTHTDFDNTCLDTYCGNLTGDFSQSYLCSYTVNLLDTMRKQSSYDSLGFLVFGATIYSRFSNINPQIMKDMLNNVGISFRKDASFNNGDLSRARKVNSYSAREVNLEIGNENYLFYEQFDNSRVYAGVDYPVNIPSLIEDSSGRSINNLNITMLRVSTCLRNPLSYQNGYVCGSVIQEINKMGLSMISIFTEYQTGRMVGTLHRKIARRKSVSSVGQGAIQSFITKLINSAVVRTILGGTIVKIGGEAMSLDSEDDFDNSNKGMNDLFTYSNETNYASNYAVDLSNEFLRANSVSFLGYAAGLMNVESKIISALLYNLLLIGIFTAFFIPLIPFWIFTVASLNIIGMFIIKVYSLSFMTAFIMKPTNNHNNKALTNFSATLFEILFKIPFLIIGIISSWLLTNILISKIVLILDFDNLLFTGGTETFSNAFYGVIFAILYSLVYLFIFIKFISLTVGMIENFETLTTSLMKGTRYNFNPQDRITDLFKRTRGYTYYAANIQKSADIQKLYNNYDTQTIYQGAQQIKSEFKNMKQDNREDNGSERAGDGEKDNAGSKSYDNLQNKIKNNKNGKA